MSEVTKPKLEVVDEETPIAPIAKPSAFSLDKFKSKRAAAIANVETLQTALPLKYRVLRNLEAAKLIKADWQNGKNPLITWIARDLGC